MVFEESFTFLTSAGDTLGLGARWKKLSAVKKLPFLV